MDELATLIRLAKHALDEKRKVMSALEEQAAKVEAEKAGLLALLEQERQRSPDALEGGLTQGAFIRTSYQKRDKLDMRLAELARQMAAVQDEIRAAFEELKRYEIAAEQRARAETREEKRREVKELDEIGGELKRRRGESSQS
jgi:hypothetical protein